MNFDSKRDVVFSRIGDYRFVNEHRRKCRNNVLGQKVRY